MLNWILAAIAATLWSTAYSWYFVGDLRRWLWRRRNRKRIAEAQRAQAYVAWMRRPGPASRARSAPSPPQAPAPPPPAAPSQPARADGNVVPFPDRRRRPPPRQ